MFKVTRLSFWKYFSEVRRSSVRTGLQRVCMLLFLVLGVINGVNATTYYSKSGSSSPNTLTNWGVNSDGTGSNPANFTTAGDVFIIRNGSTMTSTANWTITGTVQINSGGTLVINNSYSFTPGALIVAGALNCSDQSVISVSGDLSVTGTIDLVTHNGLQLVGTLNIGGNFTFTSGTIKVSGNQSTGAIVFNGSGTQLFTSGGTFSNTINFTVNSGSTLQMGTGASPSTLTGSGTFTLSTGATLGVTSQNGIATSGASGNIQVTGTRTYSAGASYIYNGTANQSVGDGLAKNCPANVEINNSGNKVSLGAVTTISGSLKMTAGTLDLKSFSLAVGDIQGSGNIDHSVAVNDTLTVGSNNASTSYTGIISNSAGSLNFIKNGSGTLTLGAANTYSGFTALNGGTIVFGVANAMPSNSTVILNGGTIQTGASTGYGATTSTLQLTQNSTINLGTGSHTLTFADSHTISWTSGTYLTITGWKGTFNGSSSGTDGKIIVGASGLSSSQLAQIQFLNSTNSKYYSATIYNGELVPSGTALVLSNLVYSSPNFFVLNTAISSLTPSISNNGATGNVSYSVSPALPTGLSLNSSSGVISGTPTVAQSLTTYTITAQDQASPHNTTTFAIQILVHTPEKFYARASGDWNVLSTWSHVNGSGTADVTNAPLPGDIVYIGDGSANGTRTVTVQGGYNARCSTIFIGDGGNNNDSYLTVLDPAASLTVSGNITMNSPKGNGKNYFNLNAGTVNLGGALSVTYGTFTAGAVSTFNYNGTTNQTVLALTYGNLTIGGTNQKNLAGNTTIQGNFTIDAGAQAHGGTSFSHTIQGNFINNGTYTATSGNTLTIQGNLTNSGTITPGTNDNFVLKGNWTNDGTFTAGTSTVTFSGTTTQTISGTPVQTFNNLTVATTGGGVVTIPSTARVTVTGALSNTTGSGSSLAIESDATNSGSLIVSGTSSGNLTYKRYMAGNQWHVVASPLSGQAINTLLTTATNGIPTSGSTYGMCYYAEGTDSWSFYTTATAPTAGNFANGQGYLLRTTSDRTVSFIGAINGDVTGIPITYGKNGWNAVGNPYTSAISLNSITLTSNNFLTANTSSLDPSYAALYVWDPVTSTYKTINNAGTGTLGTNYIQAGQGFIVRAKVGGGTMNFSRSMQLHQGGVSFKSAPIPWPTVKLVAESGSKTSNTLISFNAKMTEGLDVTYDAGMFKNNPNFALYSRLVKDNGVDFAIQCLPEKYDSLVIPIGMDAPVGTTITFRAELANLPAGYDFYLEDRVEGKLTPLAAGNSYTITLTDKNKGVGAFFLRTSFTTLKNATAVETTQRENFFKVIANPREGFIRIVSSEDMPTQVKIYDISGKLITAQSFAGGNENDVNMQGHPGIYIVQITNEKRATSQKVLWY